MRCPCSRSYGAVSPALKTSPQAAGVLIPDNTQHSWRDDVGRELEKRVGGKRQGISGRRDGRNFGYGRQLSCAGPQALKDMFGGGHYGTVKAHSDRWRAFVKWCRSEAGPGVNDAWQIDREVLSDYAAYLRGLVEHRDLAISTAQTGYPALTGRWRRFAVISM